MPSAIQKKRTWAAFVCPVCRFVFRVPKKHDGSGVVCPACDYLLKLPEREQDHQARREATDQRIALFPRGKKKSSTIVARAMDEVDSLSSNEGEDSNRNSSSRSAGRRRVKNRHSVQQQKPDWEQSTTASENSKSQQGSPVSWIVGGSLIGLLILGMGAWIVIGSMNNDSSSKDTDTKWMPEASITDYKVELTAEEKKVNQQIQESIKTGVNVLADAEDVVRKFLAAKSVDELRDLVRFPEVAMPRIEAWYKTHPLEPTEVKDVGYGGSVSVKGNMASLTIQMGDYTLRSIALERTNDGYKIDWESWVGWSEMDWDELFIKRPSEPKRLLARCVIDTYYNREFSDDTKWMAVKMTNPQSERALYGYIDRKNPSLIRLVNDLTTGSIAATVEVRYPEGSVVGNQVIISKYILNGWVAPAKQEDSTDEKE